MATRKAATNKEAALLAADAGSVIPRIAMGEHGFLGLKVSNKQIIEEANRVFRFPYFTKVVNEMRLDPTVGAVMNVYRMFMTRPTWTVEPPVGASEKTFARAKAVASMMHDMDDTWDNFIASVVPYLEYGFAVNEIILRRRLKSNGSKFNDGLVGIKKLPPRNQETIAGWKFTEDGSEVVAVEQSLANIENGYKYASKTNDSGKIEIPRKKFLLFSASKTKGNPEGQSIYKNIYLSYKQLTLLREQQLLSVAKDIQGIMKIGIPPKYLSADATVAEKAVADSFKAVIDNYNAGTQAGFVFPHQIDPETKQALFTYELMESKGTKIDIEKIIVGLQKDILSALNCDIIRLGADSTGSFNLAEQKSSILAIAIEARLKEIQSVLNQHLMRLIYEMNGWDMTEMAEFKFKAIEEINVAEFSAAVQRIAATSMIELDRGVMNKIREVMGFDLKPTDEPVDVASLPANVSGVETNAAEGMEVGTSGNGTSKIGGNSSKKDSSVSNKENSA